MEKARIVILVLFGGLALAAYLPMLWVSYLYVMDGDWAIGYGAAVGALLCVVMGIWFVLTAWKDKQDNDGHQD